MVALGLKVVSHFHILRSVFGKSTKLKLLSLKSLCTKLIIVKNALNESLLRCGFCFSSLSQSTGTLEFSFVFALIPTLNPQEDVPRQLYYICLYVVHITGAYVLK